MKTKNDMLRDRVKNVLFREESYLDAQIKELLVDLEIALAETEKKSVENNLPKIRQAIINGNTPLVNYIGSDDAQYCASVVENASNKILNEIGELV